MLKVDNCACGCKDVLIQEVIHCIDCGALICIKHKYKYCKECIEKNFSKGNIKK